MSATNHDLSAKVREQTFREDLFFRLKGILIQLPTLSERAEDIPLLASHFIQVFRKSMNRNIEGLSEDVTKIFLGYSWPGNIRELKSTIHYACALCPEEVIQKEHLPPELFSENVPDYSTGSKTDLVDTDHPGQGSEKEAILTALEKTDWNKAKTARHLGVSRAILYSKFLEYGIETHPDRADLFSSPDFICSIFIPSDEQMWLDTSV